MVCLFIFAYFSLMVSINGQEVPCPTTYPSYCLCTKSKSIFCDNMQAITVFPCGIFNNDTTWLSLEKHNIKNLTKADFEGLTGLTRFYMEKGKLSFIEEGTFQLLTNLTYVSLADNQLNSFPPGVFANLPKLETVSLDQNPFKVLPHNMFEHTPLKNLLIKNSALNSTGLDAIGSGRVAKSISKLTLPYSNIPHLAKKQFSGLLSLEDIDIAYCNIQYIHTDFLYGTKVDYVNLHGNKIVKIYPDAMRGDQITTFECRNCNLTTEKVFGTDSFIRQMKSLNRLALGHNEITHIPKGAFEGLSKIKEVLLFYNNISTVEENPFTMPLKQLKLYMQHNPFKCDCPLAWFHRFSTKLYTGTRDQDVLEDMVCVSPSNLAGKKFSKLLDSQFCCRAANSSSQVCGNPRNSGTTARPTDGTSFLKPGLLVCIAKLFLILLI